MIAKDKKSLIKRIIIAAVCLLFIVTAPIVFAAFFVMTNFNGNISYHSLSINSNESDSIYSITTLNSNAFSAPGDEREIRTNLHSSTNNDDLHYYYKIVLDDVNSNGFENAILVYFDNQFAGTLSSLCNANNSYTGILNNDSFLIANENILNANSIKFVLHNAADGSYYDNSNNYHNSEGSYFTTSNYFKINLYLCVENANVQNNIFVENELELKKAIDDINLATTDNKTIRLTNDITLTNDYNIYKSCTIDLFGHNIILGSGENGIGRINLIDPNTIIDNQPAYTVTITNTRTLVTSENSNLGIILNSNYCILNLDESANSYKQNVLVTNCNFEGVADLIKNTIKEKLKDNIQSGDDIGVSLIDSLSFYFNDSRSTITPNISDYTYSNYNISHSEKVDKTYITSISFSVDGISETISFKILGNNNDSLSDSIFDEIVNNELRYLNYLSDNVGEDDICYDLFLPTSLKAYNANIVWWSSDESILSSDGKLPDSAQGMVTLVATIRINEKVYTQSWDLYIVKQSEEMLFQYLLATIGTIKLTNIYDSNNPLTYELLPIVNPNSQYDYRIMYTNGDDIGIESLVYGPMDSTYNFILLDDKTITDPSGNIDDYNVPFVALSQATFQLYAQLPVTGYFEGDRDGDGVDNIDDPDYTPQTGFIGIEILLGNNSQLQNNVFDYIQSILDSISVLDNILNTREENGIYNETGDFAMTNSYMGFTITYAIPSNYTIGSYSLDENGIDLHFHINNFPINDSQAPINVTISITGLNPNYDENDPMSEEYIMIYATETLLINLPGAIHNNSGGFNNEKIFYSVKLQVLQQLQNPATLDGTNYISEFTTYQDVVLTGDYILRHDIANCKTLMFKYGTTSNVEYDDIDELSYNNLIDWATSTTNEGTDVSEVANIDPNYHWLSSDGESTISDVEATAILKFCERYDFFSNIWKQYINVTDNVLEVDELSYLETILTDLGYNALIEWALGTNVETAESVLTNQGLNSTTLASRSNLSNGLSNISIEEQTVILEYCADQGYRNFESIWRGNIDNSTTAGYSNYCINLNRIDDVLSTEDINLLNSFINTDSNIESTNNILTWARSTTSFSFTFSGKTYSNENITGYVSNSQSTIENYISDNEYNLIRAYLIYMGYYENDATFESYFTTITYYSSFWNYLFRRNATTVRALTQTTIGTANGTGAIISLIKSKLNDTDLINLYNWSKSNTTSTAQSVEDRLAGTPVGTLTSDGLSTISVDEQTVILYYAQNKANSASLLKRADANMITLVAWANGNSNATAGNTIASLAQTSVGNYTSDQNQNFSNNEISAMLYYYLNTTYAQTVFSHQNYAVEWGKYINLNYWDNKLTTSDLTALSNEISGDLDLEEYNNLINWLTGFGETISNTQAQSVVQGLVNYNTNYADGLSTVCQDELDALINYVQNIGLSNNVVNIYLAYLSQCVDLSYRDDTLSSGDINSLKEYIQSLKLHGDFYQILNWAMGADIYQIDILNSNFSNSLSILSSDGLTSISDDEMTIILEYLLDNGYTRLYEEINTNGLNIDLVPSLLRYYYIPVENMNGKTTGIKYFENLRRLVIQGDVEGNILTQVNDGDVIINYGNEFQSVISSYVTKLYRIDLQYCNLTTMNYLSNVPKITHLDLRGSTMLTDITNIASTNLGYLKYFNIYKTGVNFYYSECIVADAYFEYFENHISQGITKSPWYFYGVNNVLTRYIPPDSLNSEDIMPMYYCFLLKEILVFDSFYLQLPENIYVYVDDVPTSYSLNWNAVSGSVRIVDLGNNQEAVENTMISNPNVKYGAGIISVTITIPQGQLTGTYTRYFNLNITNPAYTG